ncbi:lipopolysaccharide biosynthesis protein [Flavobacterium beibuense]|uniref:Polysaccharide biosynthesis protein n=1 Tax=Flavobacterium beibuense TaxID=657326 RepID=A0A444WID9_9FLAO|nr:oligosaccharide flippase family protein [Flavobacterium beibuense]RYJ45587.1 polysaccharide biosynthesis protein [Flavobacterium beibuense]
MQEQSKRLLSNTFFYTIGNFGAKFLILILLPFLSFYLSRADLGIYDLMITALNLFVPVITLQISDAVYRWILPIKEDDQLIRKVVSNGFILISGGVLFFQVIFFLTSLFVDFKYKLFFSIMIITYCYLPFFQYVIRGVGKTKIYAIGSLLNAFSLLLLNVFFLVFFKLGIQSLFISVVLSNFLTILFYVFFGEVKKNLSVFSFEKNLLKEMLFFSVPLVPNTISWWLINASDKFLILYFLNAEFNGIYAVSTRFPSIMILLNSVFILAWQDHTITSLNSKNSFEEKVFDKYMNFEFSVVLFLISTSKYLIMFTVDGDFYDAYKYMPLLYLGVAYSAFSGFFGAAFLKVKNTKGVLVSSFFSGLINIILSFFLIPYIGLYAPALGTLVSFIFMFFLRVKQTKDFYFIKVNYSRLTYLTISCLSFAYLSFLDIKVVNIILIVVSVILLVVLNANTIKKIINR